MNLFWEWGYHLQNNGGGLLLLRCSRDGGWGLVSALVVSGFVHTVGGRFMLPAKVGVYTPAGGASDLAIVPPCAAFRSRRV